MCVYCNLGDHHFQWNPPWYVPDKTPYVPRPRIPRDQIEPWELDRLKEFRDILKEIKELEDKLGCPCVPNKADYLQMFKDRIAELEAKP